MKWWRAHLITFVWPSTTTCRIRAALQGIPAIYNKSVHLELGLKNILAIPRKTSNITALARPQNAWK